MFVLVTLRFLSNLPVTLIANETQYLGSDVMVLYLQLVVRNWVIQCAAVSVQEDLTGEQALIRFLV